MCFLAVVGNTASVLIVCMCAHSLIMLQKSVVKTGVEIWNLQIVCYVHVSVTVTIISELNPICRIWKQISATGFGVAFMQLDETRMDTNQITWFVCDRLQQFVS